ncbi:phosphoribosyltransferase family protein [Kitasatospora sp. NPDC101155]|uniref:phosphoribosyltransferase family protein n=1 Tax=Kitasatospora sp. NPDC101155 TaxID=3364097 RepID=UPI0037F990CC
MARHVPFAPAHYQCFDAARMIAQSVVGTDPEVTCVIGIASGGIKPASLMADYLKVPFHTVTARHNEGDAAWQQATGDVEVLLTDTFPERLAGMVLLVDDIAGRSDLRRRHRRAARPARRRRGDQPRRLFPGRPAGPRLLDP